MKRKPSLSVNAKQTDRDTNKFRVSSSAQTAQKLPVFVTFPSTTSLAPARKRSLLGRVYAISMVWVTQDNLISSTTILIA